jgi:hypothetical protein
MRSANRSCGTPTHALRRRLLQLVRIPCFFKTTSNSPNVASGCARTTSRITIACTSSGETLPPRGSASALPLFSHRCSHLTAVLPARENTSAASRREAPARTISITRTRKSPE